MADTTAPILLGLDIPPVFEADAFYRALLATARAADPGGEGVRRVVVYFDQPLYLADHLWSGHTDRLAIDGLFTGNTFQDATPDTASRGLPFTSANMAGNYQVTKVAVEDLAGNRAVYSQAQLQAMGVNTAFELKGGHTDTAPPQLLSLVMPASLDLSTGSARLFLAGSAQDPAGGTGLSSMTVNFDHALDFGSGSYASLTIGFDEWGGAAGQALPFFDIAHFIGAGTPAGAYRVTGVTLRDKVGLATSYTTAQLEALGVNTALQVTGSSAAPPAAPGARLGDAIGDGGFVLALASDAWQAGSDNTFRLVIGYDPTKSRFVEASLAGGGGATVAATVSENGSTATLTITGSGRVAAGSDLQVTMAQLADMAASRYEIKEFTVNGAAQAFLDEYTYRDAVKGGAGDDLFRPESQLIDGGGGFDTVEFFSAHEGATVSRDDGGVRAVTADGKAFTLTNVERLGFQEDYVVFDQDGSAAQAWRLYRAAFDRAPDREGLGFWISQLEHGLARADMAARLLVSSEFGTAATTSDFVATLYRNVLDRAPDAAGLAYWRDAIDAGLSRGEALVQFSDNPENLARIVAETANGIEYTLW